MPSNFLQHNPSAANQENDATYATDTTRTSGIGVDQILPSPWLNKVWFQSSTFVAAMAAVISAWGGGYTIEDTNLATLETNLTNFFDSLVSGGFTSGHNSNGYWQKDPNGKITQWNNNVPSGGGGGTNFTFPVAFTNAASVNVQVSEVYSSGASIIPNVSSGSVTTTGFNGGGSGSSTTNINWIATGY